MLANRRPAMRIERGKRQQFCLSGRSCRAGHASRNQPPVLIRDHELAGGVQLCLSAITCHSGLPA